MKSTDLLYLRSVVEHARQPWPVNWQAWYLQGMNEPLGLMSPERAEALSLLMPHHMPLVKSAQGWVWHADSFTAVDRSQVLQEISQNLRDKGHLQGWRNESYACWGWIENAWPYTRPELFRIERAAFRYFGLRSHAAHVHGLTSEGLMWCGRRAGNKATDPGLLDNLAAGGLTAGEKLAECAVREVLEEAGLLRSVADFCPNVCEVITEREVPEGWHSERLFVYRLNLTKVERPLNQDGEVSEFLCLSLSDVIQRIRNGEFTHDATCAIASSVINGLLEV
jgi:8-oxo-dGTP pyrophosphatase MutT (NUDIX family)